MKSQGWLGDEFRGFLQSPVLLARQALVSSIAGGLSDIECPRELLERIFDLKQKLWSSLPSPFSLLCTFCLRTTSENQMCWCQTPGSYC